MLLLFAWTPCIFLIIVTAVVLVSTPPLIFVAFSIFIVIVFALRTGSDLSCLLQAS